MFCLEKAKSPEFWKEVRENPAYASLIEQVRSYYNPDDTLDFSIIRFSQRFKFYKDGDRGTAETPYFRRRRNLSALAILALIYPENEEYLEKMQDLIVSVLEDPQ